MTITASGYLTKGPPSNEERVEEARWLLPFLEDLNYTKACSNSISDIRLQLELDTGMKYKYHSKGAIAIMLIEAGFDYKADKYGELLFNLSRKAKLCT